jgi:hypothetical protein
MKLIDYREQEVDNLSLLSEGERAEGYSISIDALNNITLLKEGKVIAWFSRLSDIDITQSLINLIMVDEKTRKGERFNLKINSDE